MPVADTYPRADIGSTLLWDDGQAAPTLTVTIKPIYTDVTPTKGAGGSSPLSPGIIGAIAAVSALVVVCIATAAILHQLWCMNPRCKACLILRCGRRRPQKARAPENRLPNLPTFASSFDRNPDVPEKGGYNILDYSPLDRHFRPDSEGGSILSAQPRLQEISGNKPQYFNAHSVISNVAVITNPYTDPGVATPTVASTFPESAAKPDQETMESSAGGENHPPSAFNTSYFNRARSRVSQASGLLSIITLPSFIANERPRPFSSSTGPQTESPDGPHFRKHSSVSGHGGDDSVLPVSPNNDENTSGKKSWPTPGALQIITSALRRSGSTSSSTRSVSPASRRSPRRFPGRSNHSLGDEDEAIIEWNRLPPLPSAQGTSTTQTPRIHTAREAENFSTERLPSYHEEEPRPSGFFAARIPLPPSPSTQSSLVSSLSYATPSPAEIPPVNGFTTPYISFPSTPGQFSYPPAPYSTDNFMGAHTARTTDRTVSLAINALNHLSGNDRWSRPNSDTPTTASHSSFLVGDDGSYGPNDDWARRSVSRRSTISAYSQHSSGQEIELPPPPPMLALPSSPPPPMSPRGPRPPPAPSRLSRSATLHSQTSSTGR